MIDSKTFAENTYKGAQGPASWLLSAERLRDGAEAILAQEVKFEIPYFQAYDLATKKAVAIAYSEGNESGAADIKARAPNYPVAQLLYAYAIENVLKGIIVAKQPSMIGTDRLSKSLMTHDLVNLAQKAGFTLYPQETPVAEALSKLAIWAARYPAALYQQDHVTTPNPDELLDYGSRHPTMKSIFDRAFKILKELLPEAVDSRYGAVVVFRQPGT